MNRKKFVDELSSCSFIAMVPKGTVKFEKEAKGDIEPRCDDEVIVERTSKAEDEAPYEPPVLNRENRESAEPHMRKGHQPIDLRHKIHHEQPEADDYPFADDEKTNQAHDPR